MTGEQTPAWNKMEVRGYASVFFLPVLGNMCLESRKLVILHLESIYVNQKI